MARWTALLLVSLSTVGCNIVHEMITDNFHEELVYRARNGDVTMIAKIAAKGLDLDEPEGSNHWTALQHAVHKQQAGAVRVLLEWGASPDATQPGNQTALFMAADSKDPAMVELLINAGADVEWQGPGGRTPLTQAVSGGALWDVTDRPIVGGCRTETVRAFMKAYPRLRVPDTSTGKTAVSWARAHDCHDVLRLIDVNPNTTGQG
jgi:ankyrin repeat protein